MLVGIFVSSLKGGVKREAGRKGRSGADGRGEGRKEGGRE
jgi:hypothetical protein